MNDFVGKVVLITGAGGGIGRVAAVQFAREGASVAVADIDRVGADETVQMIAADAHAIVVDVSDERSCQVMVDDTVARFGRLDILFSNAGIPGHRARTADAEVEDWNRVIGTNLSGVFFCARAAIPQLQKSGGGVIVNTAAVDGLVGMPSVPHYVAAKHGVIGLTKTIALEYARDNIRAVAIAPGFIRTTLTEAIFTDDEKVMMSSMVPLGRPAEPGEVANMVLWLASDKASYVTGSCHNVDAGLISGFNLPL